MENGVGFFKQFVYAFKGVVRPKYFNRMAYQKTWKMIFFGIIMSVLTSGILAGGYYFIVNDIINEELPDFTYANGVLDISEVQDHTTESGTRVVVDTSITGVTENNVMALRTSLEWQLGTRLEVFTQTGYVQYSASTGSASFFPYSQFDNFLNSVGFTEGLSKQILTNGIWKILVMILIVVLPFEIIGRFTFAPLLTAGIGFIVNKLLHGDYRFKELYKMAVYITTMVTLIKTPLTLTFIPNNILTALAAIGVLAYLYFALTGSREDIGPTSSIELGKKDGKGSGRFDLDEPEEPLPFGYAGNVKPKRTTGSISFAKTEAPKLEKETYNNTENASAMQSASAVSIGMSDAAVTVETVPAPPVIPSENSFESENTENQPTAEELVFGNFGGGMNTIGSTSDMSNSSPVEPAPETVSSYENETTSYGDNSQAEASAYAYGSNSSSYGDSSQAETSAYAYGSNSSLGGSTFGGTTGGAYGGTTGGAYGGNTGGAYGGNTGGAYGGNTGGAYGGSGAGRGTVSHMGGYQDPFDVPSSDPYHSDPLPKLGATGGTFSANEISGNIGGSTLGGSTFGASAFEGKTIGAPSNSSSTFGGNTLGGSTFGSSNYGNSAIGGSTFGSSGYTGNSSGNSGLYGQTYKKPVESPMLKSSGNGSQADKDFEEWERQHYGNQ